MKIIKRNGTEVDFNKQKIINAIKKANDEVPIKEKLDDSDIEEIASNIEDKAKYHNDSYNVEDIQDMVEDAINARCKFDLGRKYIRYRFKRELIRKSNSTDENILSLINYQNEEVKQENSNKNPQINSVARDYMAGEVSKDLTKRFFWDEELVNAHENGLIHGHDTDYMTQPMTNCCLVNMIDMLWNGTVISGTMIERPKSFHTACNVMTQIIAQVASSQYGGQSITISHIAPFVDISRQKFINDILEEWGYDDIADIPENMVDHFNDILQKRVKREVERGIQTIQYQVITLMTTNGQAPFITLFMYIDEVPEGQLRDDLVLIIEEVLKQRILGVKNEAGVYITPAFPKLIYVLDEDNIYPDSKYYYLTELAAKCTTKRLVPDYISAKVMKKLKSGNIYPPMGCRSFLTVEDNVSNENGTHKFYGRFNQGVATINLVDVALSSNGDFDIFWKIMDERLELCHRILRIRHERLLGTTSDVAPIIWQYGAYARLDKGEVIDPLLFNGYSTISLGYAGLYECVKYMTGKSHTDADAMPFAKEVMQHLNDKCKEWRNVENIAYSVYGTPLESTTYRFAKCLKKRFGVIEGITDKNYITNSYHVHVTENIDAFDKLSFEAPFQELSPGGAISYIEAPDMQDNPEAIISVMKYIYETILYAEINVKSDYCQKCGYDGEIKIEKNPSGKLIWRCPNCGNEDQNMMNVARRTCGYIGTNFWNQGRTEEINDRVLHLDNKNVIDEN